MLLVRLKNKSVIEVFHHTFNIVLLSPCEDLIVSLRLFDTLKISSQELLWIRRLLDSETLSSDGFKHMIRVLMYNNQVITLAGHIIILVSFIAHPDVVSYHGRNKTKGF